MITRRAAALRVRQSFRCLRRIDLRRHLFLCYTVLFAATALLVFSFFLRYGKSLVQYYDGLYQYYNAFSYLGSWFRTILYNIFVEHTFEIPLWEWNIGYGADVVETLAYYGLGDPFVLLSVFFPASSAETGYSIVLILRYYAAGLAFCAYCKQMRLAYFPTLLGSLFYVFSYFAIPLTEAPFFVLLLICLPLLFLGVEKILHREKPVVFVLAVFISAISNFYFFYMLAIFTVLYTLLRTLCDADMRKKWTDTHPSKVWSMCRLYLCMILYALVGICLAAVLFVPSLYAFFHSSRSDSSQTVTVFYDWYEYAKLLCSFVSPTSAMVWNRIAMAPFALLGVVAFFLQRKKDTWLKLFLGLMLVFMIFPVCGYILNGFGYVSSRWVFAYTFLVSFLFAKGYPALFSLTKKQRVGISLACTIYVFLCMMIYQSRTESVFVGVALLFVSLACVLLFSMAEFQRRRYIRKKLSYASVSKVLSLILGLTCTFYFAFYNFSLQESDSTDDFIDAVSDAGGAYAAITEDVTSAYALAEEDEDDFYRFDNSYYQNTQLNCLLADGNSSTAMYWSLTNSHIVDYIKSVNVYWSYAYQTRGLASRAMLLPLANVKYFAAAVSGKATATVPYGYSYVAETEPEDEDDTSYALYESELSLPFGFTYDNVMWMSAYENLNYARRQETMLQTAVLSDEDAADITAELGSAVDLIYDETEMTPVVISDDSKAEVDWDAKEINVKKANATVQLNFDSVSDCELYVQILGLTFESKSSYSYITEEEREEYSDHDLAELEFKESKWTAAESTKITASSGNASVSNTYFTEYDRRYEGRDDFLMHLYYSSDVRSSITLKFSQTGVYTFDSISVISQPMENLSGYLDDLCEDVMEDVTMDTNYISGTISLTQPKLLCMSLPYSEGWHVYVDGEAQELLCVNIMYSGVMLEAGDHTIELYYSSPSLKIGAAITEVGIGLLVAILIIRHEKEPKTGKKRRLRKSRKGLHPTDIDQKNL